MVDNIAAIRTQAVIRNLARAVQDRDFVPFDVVLAAGQAQVTTGATPSYKSPGRIFSNPTRELDISLADSWQAQWQMTPVVEAGDLRNLRNLYVLAVSTNREYVNFDDQFHSHPEFRTNNGCSTLQRFEFDIWVSAQAARLRDQEDAAAATTDLTKKKNFLFDEMRRDRHRLNISNECIESLRGASAELQSSSADLVSKTTGWADGIQYMILGDSRGCKAFQADSLVRYEEQGPLTPLKGLPFQRWLYWRRRGDALFNGGAAEDQPADPRGLIYLGSYDGVSLWTASQACFDDFTILVQQATPKTTQASTNPPRPQSISPP